MNLVENLKEKCAQIFYNMNVKIRQRAFCHTLYLNPQQCLCDPVLVKIRSWDGFGFFFCWGFGAVFSCLVFSSLKIIAYRNAYAHIDG